MHLFICEPDGLHDNTFLFISSNDYWKDYLLKRADYPFLRHDSFVSCSYTVTYSDQELADCKPVLLGRLSQTHLQELYKAIADSETMEGRDIVRLCQVLKVIL